MGPSLVWAQRTGRPAGCRGRSEQLSRSGERAGGARHTGEGRGEALNPSAQSPFLNTDSASGLGLSQRGRCEKASPSAGSGRPGPAGAGVLDTSGHDRHSIEQGGVKPEQHQATTRTLAGPEVSPAPGVSPLS